MAMAIQNDAFEAVGLSGAELADFAAIEPGFAPPTAATRDTLKADARAQASTSGRPARRWWTDCRARRGARNAEQVAVEALVEQSAGGAAALPAPPRRAAVRRVDRRIGARSCASRSWSTGPPSGYRVWCRRARRCRPSANGCRRTRKARNRPGAVPVAGPEPPAYRRAPGARDAAAATGGARRCWPSFRSAAAWRSASTTVERRGPVGYLYHGNPRFLNAEDDSTTSTLEIGVDLILLDPSIEVGRAARQGRRAPQVRRPTHLQRRHQSDPPVPRPDLVRGLLHRSRHGLCCTRCIAG